MINLGRKFFSEVVSTNQTKLSKFCMKTIKLPKGTTEANYDVVYTFDDTSTTESTLTSTAPTPPVWWTFDTQGYHKYSVALKANSYETLRLDHAGWIKVNPIQPLTNSGGQVSIYGLNFLSTAKYGVWEVTGSSGKASLLTISVTFTPLSSGTPVTRIAPQNLTSGKCVLYHVPRYFNIL